MTNLAVTSKRVVLKLFQPKPLVRSDVDGIRTELEQCRADLTKRIKRLESYVVAPIPRGAAVCETYANTPVLNKWARVVLSALCDKTWCFLYHPVVHTAMTTVWSSVRPRSVGSLTSPSWLIV